jgi:DNA-binding MarR family transcriptional regulator
MQESFDSLFHEVRLLSNTLVRTGEQLHDDSDMTPPRRGVLEHLLREGPSTVPAIARARRVSRQHIQALVNPLLHEGLVERIDNPAHRRSKLLRLTAAGWKVIDDIRTHEAHQLGQAGIEVSDEKLREAAGVLRHVREALES